MNTGSRFWRLVCDNPLRDEIVNGRGDSSHGFFRFAKQLQSLENQNDWSCEQNWEMITEVWMEMLAYAASRTNSLENAHPCPPTDGTS
ncbi:hypothetical protein EZV62_003324 [Acer yangbiense]|uniref:Uncharacterized protein n=1 Tax=Acer yangbiense TaxID=1000413 RepID=A0A5C7IH80_9ROSI|nr:hypothetical protein EZV62_003324 [Acer yangbiense]